MARAMWKGAISFGLVNIPVELQVAVRSQRPRFHLLHGKDDAPVRYQRVCTREDREVPWPEIVKGFEVDKGEFVVLDKKDFERAALDKSRTIDIHTFVAASEIDERYFDTPYYLVPDRGGERAYALLREAIRDAGKVGIAQFILRDRQHVATLATVGDALVLTTLRFADELVDIGQLSFPSAKQVREKEREVARTLVDSLAGPWDPTQYHDQYTANLLAIIKSKAKGKTARLSMPGPAQPKGEVVDLMEKLRESLGQAGRKRPARAPRAAARRARGGARKTSTRRRHHHRAA